MVVNISLSYCLPMKFKMKYIFIISNYRFFYIQLSLKEHLTDFFACFLFEGREWRNNAWYFSICSIYSSAINLYFSNHALKKITRRISGYWNICILTNYLPLNYSIKFGWCYFSVNWMENSMWDAFLADNPFFFYMPSVTKKKGKMWHNVLEYLIFTLWNQLLIHVNFSGSV